MLLTYYTLHVWFYSYEWLIGTSRVNMHVFSSSVSKPLQLALQRITCHRSSTVACLHESVQSQHCSKYNHGNKVFQSSRGSITLSQNILHKQQLLKMSTGKIQTVHEENLIRGRGSLRHFCTSHPQCSLGKGSDLSETLDTILSGRNKKRVQESLLSVRPARSMETSSASGRVKRSAVLVPLCTVQGQPSFLFTLRSSNLRKHRGEVSFPGGFQEDADPDITHTALRETQEELGIDPATVDVWGELQSVPSSRDGLYIVTPILANIGEVDINSLTLNKEEVDLVFTRTVESLCDLRNTASTQFRTGRGYTLPLFLGGQHRIWGLTAIILHQTLTLLAPGLYRFKVRHRS